jgi:phenylacetate-CoA ligase
MPAFQVEGRTDEILSLQGSDGVQVQLLPLALETVVEETPGLRRFQLIQTGLRTLTLRLEVQPGVDEAVVWSAAEARLMFFLTARGLGGLNLERSQEAPRPNAHGGKLRHVYSELRARARVAHV